MPEYASLHRSAHQVNEHCVGRYFVRVEVNSQLDSRFRQEGDVEDGARWTTWPGTEKLCLFTLSARARGKEVCIRIDGRNALQDDTEGPQNTSPPPCLTCRGCFLEAHGESTVPLCDGHRKPTVLRPSRAVDRKRRQYFGCAEATASRCRFFQWKDEVDAYFGEEKGGNSFDDDGGGRGEVVYITFRRGMSGSFRLRRLKDVARVAAHDDEYDGDREARKTAASATHVRFIPLEPDTEDALLYVHARVRSHDASLFSGGKWSPSRSADPVYEYEAFREKLLLNLRESDFELPICELLLDQRYFNGVGNYLRAEILDRAACPPFARAREALKDRFDDPKRDIAAVTRHTCAISVTARSARAWHRVFQKRFAKHEVDHLGRVIWYRGERGAMAPPALWRPPSCSLQLHTLPPHLCDVGALRSAFSPWKPLTVAVRERRRSAAVRFATVSAAGEALEALPRVAPGGGGGYKERIRRRGEQSAEEGGAAACVVADEDSEHDSALSAANAAGDSASDASADGEQPGEKRHRVERSERANVQPFAQPTSEEIFESSLRALKSGASVVPRPSREGPLRPNVAALYNERSADELRQRGKGGASAEETDKATGGSDEDLEWEDAEGV